MELAALPIQFEEARSLQSSLPEGDWNLAGGKAAGRRPRCASPFFFRPGRGGGNHFTRQTPAPLPGCIRHWASFPGATARATLALPPAKFRAPSGSVKVRSRIQLRCPSPSPRPSPAGRGRNFAAATDKRGVPVLSKAATGPLSQRERDGVRESTRLLFSRPLQPANLPTLFLLSLTFSL